MFAFRLATCLFVFYNTDCTVRYVAGGIDPMIPAENHSRRTKGNLSVGRRRRNDPSVGQKRSRLCTLHGHVGSKKHTRTRVIPVESEVRYRFCPHLASAAHFSARAPDEDNKESSSYAHARILALHNALLFISAPHVTRNNVIRVIYA